ncbi:MAG: hypothetical protein LBI91_03295, partial [Spirochaetaceae bacterium]|nr:hypothetical protein [Spirochaetaceae bacterium]
LIEQYDSNGDTWNAIPVSLIGENAVAGSQRGTVALLQRTTGLVRQSGFLDLPPGEYRLTATVSMDGPYPPVSRTDIAHIFSNLTTPAPFFYGSGDLTITSSGMDSGSGFITRFNFSQTPGAVSIVGSSPGPDGTRLIMVMVPPGTNLTRLNPVVECAEGAFVASPPPLPDPGPDGKPFWDTGDYSRPTSWTAEGKNGVTQQYTVVVTEAAAGDCFITDIAFRETGLESAPDIDQDAGTINVVLPHGTLAAHADYVLTPVFSYLGTEVKLADSTAPDNKSADVSLSGTIRFMNGSPPARRIFRVYAQDGAAKLYTVTLTEAADHEAEITKFVFDSYPDRQGVIKQPSGPSYDDGTITVQLPYGAGFSGLKPLIAYKGKLSPASGAEQNFNVPVVYTVRAEDNSITKTYRVTVSADGPDTDTGIFDFVIANVPKAKVVIGTKPRADGKIPIVVSVPYATSPLTADGSRTDLTKLIPKITLSSNSSKFIDGDGNDISPPNGATDTIPFGNQNDYQEAIYRIKAQAGNTQDYVVIVARDIHYYYVSASGDDKDPDYYNGSEQAPFKTLAHAVYQAVIHNVDHIYVIGTLNDTSEGGAWEDTSATVTGNSGTFRPNGAPSVAGGGSVFNLKGAGRNGTAAWPVYITGIGSNAVLQGTNSKRVISITGGAHITFDNIAIRGGGGTSSYAGNGGGMYIGENSTVIWKSGNITGSRALSGGGVYVDNSEFDFMTGSISSNTATGSAATDFTTASPSVQGGGGVYVNGGNGLFWLANGEISGNSTSGSGGGVLVNGSDIPNNPGPDGISDNFIMSGGAVNSNVSTGNVWPHGGGGVFVAKGAFEMLNGQIMHNKSTRQGGGVFVWSRSLFDMSGNSSVTDNDGVGSSKAICSRGITTMRGNAQADKVYIWNYSKGSWNNGFGDEFTLMEGARISGLVLAFADDPQDNRNYINIVQSGGSFFTGGTDPITNIGLESHLNPNGSFAISATIDGDWLGKYLIKNGGNLIPAGQTDAPIERFLLGTFTYGGSPMSLGGYKLDNTGKLAK